MLRDGPYVLDLLPSEELAQEAVDALRRAGVEAYVVLEKIPGADNRMTSQEGPKVVVRERDAEDAWQLYAAWTEAVELGSNVPRQPWTCTGCGEHHGPNADTCWQCGTEVDPSQVLPAPAAVEPDEDRPERLARALENIDARAASRADEPAAAFDFKRVAFRLVLFILLAWGLKALVVHFAAR